MTALLTQVLDMTVTASIAILAVLAARLCLRRAPKVISYALWAVVLFRLLCPVSLSGPVSLVEVAQPMVTATSQGTSSISYFQAAPQERPVWEVTPPVTVPEVPRSGEASKIDLRTWAAWIWLAGAAGMALHGATAWLRLRRRLVGAVPCGGRVYRVDRIPTPFVLGVFRPRIYIPSGTEAEELPYILAHETHHIRRLDHIIKLVAYGALCIHWFNPLVWLAFFLAGKDMEMSCDEAVIRKLGPEIRADYAQSLLRLATRNPGIAGIPLTFGGGNTKGRVKNMAKWRKPKARVVLASTLLCAAVLVACGLNPALNEERIQASTEGTAEDPEALMAKCRTALEALQGQEAYGVTTHRLYYAGSLTSTTDHCYWKSGDDWLLISHIPDDGFQRGYSAHGVLYAGGAYYSNNNHDSDKWDENEDILWSPGGADSSAAPWIAWFSWEDAQVQYVSHSLEGSEERIALEVEGPYFQTHAKGYCLMQFTFDENGKFLRLENEVDTVSSNGSRLRFTETIQVVAGSARSAVEGEKNRVPRVKCGIVS